MPFDPTPLITGLSGAGATVWAAALVRSGRRNNKLQRDANSSDGDTSGVSLTKTFMAQQQAELDYCRKRMHQMEILNNRQKEVNDTIINENEHLIAKNEQLLSENEFLNKRNKELGGP